MSLPLTIDTTPAPSLTVVVLHGHAMRPDDLAPFARSMGVPARFVFPQAPLLAKGGGYSWWPIDEEARLAALRGGGRDLHETHPEGRPQARAGLARLLRSAALRGKGCRCVLVGFSQGGILACDTLLLEDVKVDALALFSSCCIALDEWRPVLRKLRGLPVLVAHGAADGDLSQAAGIRLRDELAAAGAQVRWCGFEGGHEVPLQVWRALRTLLREELAAIASASPPPD